MISVAWCAPFTTGFFAKFYVVEAAVSAHSYALAAVAMGTAAVAAFFYLRLVFLMFSDVGRTIPTHEGAATGGTPTDTLEMPSAGGVATLVAAPVAALVEVAEPDPAIVAVSPWVAAGLVLCVATTLVFGVWPQPLVDFAHQATLII